ncbi:MAG: helix-turn-helix transcriptional regulator [Nitrospirae bacterium]|nr:helix-turn-helix transcriptional regulator [Nitrospirota bacterium]
MKDKNKEICQKIREIRKSLKLTQSQFAEICNLSEDSIGKIERCVTVPTLETLYKIARSIKKPVEAILPSANKEKFCSGLPEELTALVDYLRSRPADDVKLLHELAVKIFERRR